MTQEERAKRAEELRKARGVPDPTLKAANAPATSLADRAAQLRQEQGVVDPTLQNIQQPLAERTIGTDLMFPVDAAVRTGNMDPIIQRGMNDPRTQERMASGGISNGPLGWLTGMFSPDEGKQFSEAESAAYGALDPFTGGSPAAFLAGAGADDNVLKYAPSVLKLPLGIGNAAANVVFGNPAIPPSEELQQDVDRAISENRGASLIGQVVGAVGPGAVTAALAKKALTKLPATYAWLTDTFMGRALVAAPVGALEGGIYARAKDANVPLGALGGAVGGMAGSAVLDLVGKGVNALFGAASKTSARQMAGQDMAYPTGTIDRDEIVNAATELGQKSILPDINQPALERAESNVMDPSRNFDSRAITNMAEARLGNPRIPATGQGQVYEDFTASMRSMLPKGFDPISGHLNEAVAPDTMQRISKEYFTAISDEFGAAVRNSSISANPTRFPQVLERASRGPNIPKPQARGNKNPVNAGIRSAWNKVRAELERQTSYKYVPVPGGFRGEKMRVTLPYTASQLHNLRMYIDEVIDGSYDAAGATSISKNEMASLSRMRTAINDQLNKDPTLADVNRRYATQSSYMRSYNLGTGILSRGATAKSADEVENWMASANPGDVNGFIHGVSRVLVDNIRKPRGEGTTARRIALDDELGDRLRAVFPQYADQIIKEANAALLYASTASNIVRGSQTGRRSMMQQRENPSRNLLDIATVSGAIYNVFNSGGGMSRGAGASALRRLLPTMVDPDETAEMARILTAQGPENIGNVLDQITQAMSIGENVSPLSFPRTMQGPDTSLAARAARDAAIAAGQPDPGLPLGTQDIGQTLPYSLGLLTPGFMFNTDYEMGQREQQRRADELMRKSPR